MSEFLVEAYYKNKLVMCLPSVEADKYRDALEIGKKKMGQLHPKMKNHNFNIKKIR